MGLPTVKKYKPIPKIIHQIWIGTKPRPKEWMDTWSEGFCKKYKWKYMLWDNEAVEKMSIKNIQEFNNATSFQQKSDILRYEILYRYGGFYLDADMIWMKESFETHMSLKDGFIGVKEPYSLAYDTIKSPYLANGFFGCAKGHDILKMCIKKLPGFFAKGGRAWQTTGPVLLSFCVNIPITVLPTCWIFPESFKQLSNGDPKLYYHKALVFTKSGFSYPGMTLLDYAKRIVSV